MSGKQRAVLWLGILLIALNLVSKWSQVKAVIFSGGGNPPSGSGGGNGGGKFGIPGFPLPGGVVLPGGAVIPVSQPTQVTPAGTMV